MGHYSLAICRFTIIADKKTVLPSKDSALPADSISEDGYVISKGLSNAAFKFRNPRDDELDVANYVKWER